MNTYKKLKLKITTQKVALGLTVLAMVALGGYSVHAYTNHSDVQPSTIIENASNVTVNQAQAPEIPLSNQDTAPVLGAANNYVNCNGLDCVYSISQKFIDASNTIISIVDPILIPTSTFTPNSPILEDNTTWGRVGATATVEMARLTITGAATTSLEVDCSASSNPGTTSTVALIDTESIIGTSTIGVIESTITSSTNFGMGSLVLSTTGESGGIKMPIRKILLTPQKPYFVCKVFQAYGTDLGPVTSGANAFDGIGLIRVSRSQY